MINSRKRMFFQGQRQRALAITAIATMTVSSCAVVGPSSIDHGRISYNEVIDETSRQQVLLNIVRVSKGETPLFMDVTEVDAATSVAASAGGGESAIGATPNFKSTSAGTITGALGSITGIVSYQEAPTVRYFPLSGQALIAQVSTPLAPDSLVNLYNSDWPLAAILDFGVDRVTLGYEDYDAAIDAMIDLDQYGALILAATPSSARGNPLKLAGLTISSGASSSNDNLTLYFVKRAIAERQARCDGSLAEGKDSALLRRDAERIVDVLWTRLVYYVTGSGRPVDSITINSKGSVSGTDGKAQPPLLRTRSALGVVKAATDTASSRPSIAFLPPDQVRKVIDDYKARPAHCRSPFYTLDPAIFTPSVFGHGTDSKRLTPTEERVSALVTEPDRSLITAFTNKPILTPDELRVESDLVNARRFMLVAYSETPPENSSTAVYKEGKWYYIFDDDDLSKKNLALIAQINTIQAIPSQSAPLTPTISVGARQ